MKTAEEILKSKLDGKITFVNNQDYTFNKVIEAMEEYRLQSHPSPMSADDWQIIALDEDGTQHQVKHENGSAFTGNYQQCLSFYELVSGKSPMSAEQVEVLHAIMVLAEHGIPGYAFGDNEAACEMDNRLSEICRLASTTPSVKADGLETVKVLWSTLTDEQRLELACCKGCGSLDTSCQCLNDE